MLEIDRTFILREVQKLIDMNREVDELQKEMDEVSSGSYRYQKLERQMDELQAVIDNFILGEE